MQPSLLAISDWFYRLFLRIYPAGFRERFAAEMAQVFRSLCGEEFRQSGVGGLMRLWLSTLWDGAWAAFYQWEIHLFNNRMEAMQMTLIDRRDGINPLTPVQAGIAALPFLAFGVSSMISRMEYLDAFRAGSPLWQIFLVDPSLVFNWLVLIGLGVGILAGFPRWAFSFLGWALLFGWWWSDMGFYGYHMDWKIWLPFLGVFAVALLIRRSLSPLRALFSGLWREWTLLALGVYILFASVYLVADEVHHPSLVLFIAITTLVLSAGAFGYFHSKSPLRRVLSLVGGMVLAVIIGVYIDPTWDLIIVSIVMLFMVGIGLLTVLRYRRDPSLNKY